MSKKRIVTIKTGAFAQDTTPEEDNKLIRQLAFLLFTAAGKTGGSFKVEKAAIEAYEAASGDLQIRITEEELRGNGDLFVTIIRDRDNKPDAKKAEK